MSSRGPKKLQSEQTRARIEESATRLFVTQGYSATSTAQIAKAAGLSSAAMYVHFPSKEALLLGLLQLWERKYLDVLIPEVNGQEGDAKAKLHRLVSVGGIFAAKNKELCLLLAIVSADLYGAGNAIGNELRRIHERYADFVAGVVEQGQNEGVLDSSMNPKTFGYVIVGAYNGVLLEWQRSAGRFEGRELVQVFRHMLFKGCEAGGDAGGH